MITVWLAMGCVDTVRFPPDLWGSSSWRDSGIDWGIDGDTSTSAETDRVQVETVSSAGCVGSDAWLVEATTDGWTLGATLDLFRATDGRAEQHELGVVGTDPDGLWDRLSSGPIADGVDPAKQVAGVNSTFDCTADADALTFAIRVTDRSSTRSDCVVWGADPAELVLRLRTIDPDVTGLGGCRLWPFEGARR